MSVTSQLRASGVLSMIATAETVQGRGLGRTLLVDAIVRVATVSEKLRLAAIVLDAIGDGGEGAAATRQRFYERMVLGMRQARAIRNAVER